MLVEVLLFEEVLVLVDVFPQVVVVLLPEVFVVELLLVLLPEVVLPEVEVLVVEFVLVVFQVFVEVLVAPVEVVDPVDITRGGSAVSSQVINSSTMESLVADAIKSTDPIRSVLIPVIPKATISFLEKREYMAGDY